MSIPENSSEYTILWQSEEQLRHRIAQDSLPNYIPVVRRVVIEFFQEYQHSRELEAHVAFALTPDFVPLFEVQVQPECEPSRVAQLLKRLETIEAPPVWNGPVAASTGIKIGTGCNWTAAHIEFPFSKTMAFLSAEESFDDYLMRYATAEKNRQRTPGVLLKKWLLG